LEISPFQGKQGRFYRVIPGKARSWKGKSGPFGKIFLKGGYNWDKWTTKGT